MITNNNLFKTRQHIELDANIGFSMRRCRACDTKIKHSDSYRCMVDAHYHYFFCKECAEKSEYECVKTNSIRLAGI